ncbi:MAG TPA: LamG domain-containing protein, partial [Candidatus Pacearchaeota archaeon]|nr:LamG domain-containing protein [Candidatus Pacearchaeota archaeon]
LYGTNGLPQLRPASECVTDSCFLFDGVDDFVYHGSITFSSTQPWTSSHWLNWQGYSTNPAYVFYMGTGNTCNGLLLRSNTDNQFCIRNVDCGYVCFSSNSSNAYYNSGWFHVTWVADGLSKLSLYINGKFLQTVTGNTATTFEQLGNGYNISGGYLFKGLIDDVRLYNSAISTSEIKQNYIAGLNSMLSNGNISNEEYNERINELAYDK